MSDAILTKYERFVQAKRRVEVATGHAPGALNTNLFDFQHAIVSWAVRRGRAAIFADTGLGKTLMQLSWADEVANQTNGIVVVLAPLAVSEQTIEQGQTFGNELKPAYYELACQNIGDARKHEQDGLFVGHAAEELEAA